MSSTPFVDAALAMDSDVSATKNCFVPTINHSIWEAAMQSQLEAWFADPEWSDDAPDMKVTVGSNALCQLDGVATVALPPDSVFSTVCDPYNRRVFKNVKSVSNLVVVSEADGVRVEEMDMVFAFHLPFFTGTFDAHVRMVKDRRNRKMSFALTRPGFMKRFEGHWTVEPMLVPCTAGAEASSALCPGSPTGSIDSDSDVSASMSLGGSSCSSSPDNQVDSSLSGSDTGVRVASRLILHQVVQPSLAPPAIFKRCIHTILQMATSDVLKVFQEEAQRVRHKVEDSDNEKKSLTSKVWGMMWSTA
eukprot:TRINITY_DN14815_c0_g1_i1.p1 TRINITY_DN14815_c0_g1~~TRINITY_DN14815_c0_g1_i1.p1  ORF type:complete len:304 (-),score=18.58 TRINITY_DN14815_c0_g1_i1:199-1110(-)